MTIAGSRPRPQGNATPSAAVARLRGRDDAEEIARINRLTGLSFESVPVSLLKGVTWPAGCAETGALPRTEPSSRPARC